MSRAPFQMLVLPFRRDAQGQPEYALFRRAALNVWQGITGRGKDDETPEQAAVRELREETRITTTTALLRLDAVGAIGVEHFQDRSSWDPMLRTIPEYGFGVAVESPALSLSAEHREFAWLVFEAALARLEWESNRIALCELHNRLDDPAKIPMSVRANETLNPTSGLWEASSGLETPTKMPPSLPPIATSAARW